MSEPVVYATEHMTTALGGITIFAHEHAVVAIEFREHAPKRVHPNALTTLCARELQEYFSGERKSFSFPIAFHGTPFQKKVWHAIHRIKYGKTRSYSDIAKSIGHAKAVRAVGTATGKNPLCICVPCHRVLPTDGSIGNYASGPAKKAFLLTLEHRNV
jgi:methylated-DNA-[protein]-cysteine S-methyltransferase